jgi:tetratricopeptide (TPR) repeat protein
MEVWANAEKGFASALRIDPKSGLAALNLAHCKAWQKAAAKDVAAAYVEAVRLLPADEKALANTYNWTPSGERVALFTRLVDEMPGSVTRRLYLAFSFKGEGQYDKAIEVLAEAAKLEPGNAYVPLNAGDLHLSAGKLDEAVAAYAAAAELFRGRIDQKTYDRLAFTVPLTTEKMTQEQRVKLWTALWKAFPDRAGAANNAGLYFRDEVKDYEQSREWYVRAATVAQDDACIQNDTGLVFHYHFNDLEKAEPYYRRAVLAGEAQGLHWNAPAPPGMGYRDALNNLGGILATQKRWNDLRKFVEDHVPQAHPMHDAWLKQAEEKK